MHINTNTEKLYALLTIKDCLFRVDVQKSWADVGGIGTMPFIVKAHLWGHLLQEALAPHTWLVPSY